jgi:hypothetical protein
MRKFVKILVVTAILIGCAATVKNLKECERRCFQTLGWECCEK